MCTSSWADSFVVAVGVFARLLFLEAYYCIVSTVFCCKGILVFPCLAPILISFSFSLSSLDYYFCIASLLSLLFSAAQLPSPHGCLWVRCRAACAPWSRLPLGRVMYEWLALTSLQAQRHSNSALPGLLFLVLSLSASPLFLLLLSSINHLSFLLFFFCVSSVMSPLFYCFPFSTSVSLSCLSFFIALANVKTCLSSLSTLLLVLISLELSILI